MLRGMPPVAESIDRGAVNKPILPSVLPLRRATTLAEHLAKLRETAAEKEHAREALQPAPTMPAPPAPKFGREEFLFARGINGSERPKEPIDWSGIDTTLTGFPVPKGVPGMVEQISKRLREEDSRRFWADAGLPPLRRKKAPAKKEEPVEIRAHLESMFEGLSHPAKEVLLNMFMESAEEGFSVLKAGSAHGSPGEEMTSLQMVCSGGRAPFINESEVGSHIATVSSNYLHKLNAMKARGAMAPGEAASFNEHLIRAILSVSPPAEGEEKSELEMRNGFLRGCAWCICACTDPALLSEFLARNGISLIDGVGIATGLATNEAKALLEDGGVRENLYRLIEKKWVSSAFEHLAEMLRANAKEGKLNAQDISSFTVLLLKEAREYQKIAQYCSVLARNLYYMEMDMAKAEKGGEPGKSDGGTSPKLIFLTDWDFYILLRTRIRATSELWRNIDKLHDFVAARVKYSSGASGAPDFVIGRRPREISQLFTTLLQSLDALSENGAIREMALTALERHEFSSTPSGPYLKDSESFRKIFALCLFRSQEDVERHRALLESIGNPATNPIINGIVAEHVEDLANGRLSRTLLPPVPSAPVPEMDDSDAPF